MKLSGLWYVIQVLWIQIQIGSVFSKTLWIRIWNTEPDAGTYKQDKLEAKINDFEIQLQVTEKKFRLMISYD